MKKSSLMPVLAVCFCMMACQKNVPVSVSMPADQFEINGKTSAFVHADTADIVFLRDTLADEKADSFALKTTLTLLLDSAFSTDKMEEVLSLQLASSEGDALTTLCPVDSLLEDSLIHFLQKKPGQQVTIDFQGMIGRQQLIKMAEGVKATMAGFSFLYADPEANYLLSEYRKGLDELLKLAKEAKQATARDPFSAWIYVMAITQVVDQMDKKIDKKLLAMKDRMSARQQDLYAAYHTEMKSYENNQRRR